MSTAADDECGSPSPPGRRRGLGAAAVAGAFATLLGACGPAPERPATWSYVSLTVIQPACATSGCHSQRAAVSGLRLDEIDLSYQALRDGRWIAPSATTLDAHPIDDLLRGRRKPMPPDEPLPEEDLRLVEQWLLAGARAE